MADIKEGCENDPHQRSTCKIDHYQVDCSDMSNVSRISDIRNPRVLAAEELNETHPHYTVEDLPNPLPQNFSVDAGTANFDCFFHDCNSDYLFVFLRAWRMSRDDFLYGFERWTYYNYIHAKVLAVNNPMYYYFPDLHTGYYIGSENENYLLFLSDIIKRIAAICSIPYNHIVLMGSSSGGTASIHCSYLIPESFQIAINPQILPNLEDYLIKDLQKSNITLSNLSKERMDTKYCLRNGSSHCLIITNVASQDDLAAVRNMCADMGLKIHYGFNSFKDERLFVWLYEAYGIKKNTGHTSFENRAMMLAIEYLVKTIIENRSLDPAIPCLFSEFWYDGFEIHTIKEIERYRDEIAGNIRRPNEIIEQTEYGRDNPIMAKYKAEQYLQGKYVNRDLSKSIGLMKEAVRLDNSLRSDLINTMWMAHDDGIDQEMISLIQLMVSESNPIGYGWMGRAYRDGRAVKADLSEASKWMFKCADANIHWAKWEYFEILWKMNTPESLKAMIEYAQSESDKGNMELRARLARAYRDGKGVDKDLTKAAELMRSVLPGYPLWARWEFLDILRSINTSEADREAFEYGTRNLEGGDREIEARVARMYRDGRGTAKDIDKAVVLMKAASDKGLGWAKNELFDMLQELHGSKMEGTVKLEHRGLFHIFSKKK